LKLCYQHCFYVLSFYLGEDLSHRRTSRIRTAWTSETSNDFALLFVIRGISGDTLATPIDFDHSINSLQLRTLLYVIPISDSLHRRFGGHLPISTLRWLLRLRVGHGIIRLFLLWNIRRWDLYRSSRRCLKCGLSFNSQSHVLFCCDMRSIFATHPDLATPTETEVPIEFTIEFLLTLLSRLDPPVAYRHIHLMESTIRSCLALVFGETVNTM